MKLSYHYILVFLKVFVLTAYYLTDIYLLFFPLCFSQQLITFEFNNPTKYFNWNLLDCIILNVCDTQLSKLLYEKRGLLSDFLIAIIFSSLNNLSCFSLFNP